MKKEITALELRLAHGEYFHPGKPQAIAVEDVAEPADMRLTIRGNPYALGDTMPRGLVRVAKTHTPQRARCSETGDDSSRITTHAHMDGWVGGWICVQRAWERAPLFTTMSQTAWPRHCMHTQINDTSHLQDICEMHIEQYICTHLITS